jgi:hypothetical protein
MVVPKEVSMLRMTLLALLALVPLAALADEGSEKAAASAASMWLQRVDAGRYGESWDEAAQLFRGAISKDDWTKTLAGVRGPLGKVVSRKLISKKYAESLPGAPDGKYVVIQYETAFENKKSAIETVTPMLDADGRWRVSGYFIK